MKHAYLIFFFLFTLMGVSQTDSIAKKDTLAPKKIKKDHKPRTAAILSAIVPGAGQVFNFKNFYWKVPVIYGALGGFGYYFLKNQNQYTYYRSNLKALVAGDSTVITKTGYNTDQLQTQKLVYRKHRDLLAFGIIAVYAIQIIDANVEAHLKTFDVSDDLSLQINARPVVSGNAIGAGISLKLNFK